MNTYPGSYADSIILQGRIAEWERRERAHERSPSLTSDAARKAAGAAVDKQRALIIRRIKGGK